MVKRFNKRFRTNEVEVNANFEILKANFEKFAILHRLLIIENKFQEIDINPILNSLVQIKNLNRSLLLLFDDGYNLKEKEIFSDLKSEYNEIIDLIDNYDGIEDNPIRYCPNCLKQKQKCDCGSIFLEDTIQNINLINDSQYRRLSVIIDVNKKEKDSIIRAISFINTIPTLSDSYLVELKKEAISSLRIDNDINGPVEFLREIQNIVTHVENLYLIYEYNAEENTLYEIESSNNCLSCLILAEGEPTEVFNLPLIPNPLCNSAYCTCRYKVAGSRKIDDSIDEIDFVDDLLHIIKTQGVKIEIFSILKEMNIGYNNFTSLIGYLRTDNLSIEDKFLNCSTEFSILLEDIISIAMVSNNYLLAEKILILFQSDIALSSYQENLLKVLNNRLMVFVEGRQFIHAERITEQINKLGGIVNEDDRRKIHQGLVDYYLSEFKIEEAFNQISILKTLVSIDPEEIDDKIKSSYEKRLDWHLENNDFNQADHLLDQLRSLSNMPEDDYMNKLFKIKEGEFNSELKYLNERSEKDDIWRMRNSLQSYRIAEDKLTTALINNRKRDISKNFKMIFETLEYVPQINLKYWKLKQSQLK